MSRVLLAALAIVLQVAGTTNMKLSQSFTKRVPSVLVVRLLRVERRRSDPLAQAHRRERGLRGVVGVGHGVHCDDRGECLRRGIDRGQGSRAGPDGGGGRDAQHGQPDALDEPYSLNVVEETV
jgi:hypothetical protein